jgi:serine protease
MRTLLTALAALAALSLAVPAAGLTPNDPRFSEQWNLRQIQAPGAWDREMGSRRIKVAVVDTGAAYENHQEFVLVSDLAQTIFDRENAYDFAHGDRHPNDASGHGTHVTGTLAQSTDNLLGVAGTAPGITVLPVQAFLADNTATLEMVAQALHYAVDQEVDIINLSAGSLTDHPGVREACRRAHEAGILVVAAAGNQGWSILDYPAAYPTVLAVGAVTADGQRAYYSNYGPELLMAPGGTLYEDADADGHPDAVLQQWSDGGYRYMAGTSMAAPHVSGVAALVLSEARSLGLALPAGEARARWLRAVLINSARDLGPAGPDAEYGYGLVCAEEALAYLHRHGQMSAAAAADRWRLDPAARPRAEGNSLPRANRATISNQPREAASRPFLYQEP